MIKIRKYFKLKRLNLGRMMRIKYKTKDQLKKILFSPLNFCLKSNINKKAQNSSQVDKAEIVLAQSTKIALIN